MISPSRRTRNEVCKQLGWVALVAISTNERVPRSFGDNLGVRPVLLAVTADPNHLETVVGGHQLVHEASVLREWWSKDRANIVILKAHTEALLWQQGATRVSEDRSAWDMDLGLLELCVRQAADADAIILAKQQDVDASVLAEIRRGVEVVARKRRAQFR